MQITFKAYIVIVTHDPLLWECDTQKALGWMRSEAFQYTENKISRNAHRFQSIFNCFMKKILVRILKNSSTEDLGY